MPIIAQESFDLLRQRIDLVEVVSQHVDLKRQGAVYKGLCPFHDEKTPSFNIQRGDKHFHCFGCGAHGDAIKFLMDFLKMDFVSAVETLAQRFGVVLQQVEGGNRPKGPSKSKMKEALEYANQLFHFFLLHSEEEKEALEYLYQRGLDLDFIRQFQIGLAPKRGELFLKAIQEKGFKDFILREAGLIGNRKGGGVRSFFSDRITFPIRDAIGQVIGFSARKYREETFGGKYVNTPETPLFKKSRVLFGLNYCRRRIAKEHRALIVEGQVDALRLIHAGFNITVAGQGTAFGEGHAKELLNLGVRQVFLALDADEAGREAASKIGNLFQKEGVEVLVLPMPAGSDPDSLLNEEGPSGFQALMEKSVDYLTFLVQHQARFLDTQSPAGKSELVRTVSQQIRDWENPVMVHESLRKLASLTQVPEGMVGVGQPRVENIHIQKSGTLKAFGEIQIDPDRILEGDLLRWLLVLGETNPEYVELIRQHVKAEDLQVEVCREVYEVYSVAVDEQKPRDPLALVARINHEHGQELISELLSKKINKKRAEELIIGTIQRILERNWMRKREAVRLKIDSAGEDDVMGLVKEFNSIETPSATEIKLSISARQR